MCEHDFREIRHQLVCVRCGLVSQDIVHPTVESIPRYEERTVEPLGTFIYDYYTDACGNALQPEAVAKFRRLAKLHNSCVPKCDSEGLKMIDILCTKPVRARVKEIYKDIVKVLRGRKVEGVVHTAIFLAKAEAEPISVKTYARSLDPCLSKQVLENYSILARHGKVKTNHSMINFIDKYAQEFFPGDEKVMKCADYIVKLYNFSGHPPRCVAGTVIYIYAKATGKAIDYKKLPCSKATIREKLKTLELKTGRSLKDILNEVARLSS